MFKERFPEFAGKVGLVGQPGANFRQTPPGQGSEEVADPFGSSTGVYQATATRLRELLAGWKPVFEALGRQSRSES